MAGHAQPELDIDLYRRLVAELRPQVRDQILNNENLPAAVRFQANNLFLWRYQHLFEELVSLKQWLADNSITELRVHAPLVEPIGQTVFRGEEGKRILWRPEFEYPWFVDQLCRQLGVRAIFDRTSTRQRLAYNLTRWRGWIFFGLKAAPLLFRALRTVTQRLMPRALPHFGSLFVARSRSQIEFYQNLRLHPNAPSDPASNEALGLVFDPTLYDSSAFDFFARKYNSPEWLVPSTRVAGVTDVLRSIVGVVAAALRLSKVPISLQAGGIQLSDPFLGTCRELTLFSLDQQVHRQALERAIRGTGAKRLISLESISPYIFLHDGVARSMGLRSLRFQAAATTENEAVDLAASDGYFADSEDLRERLSTSMAHQRQRIHYAGNPLYRPPGAEAKVAPAPAKTTMLYFSQPHEPGSQNTILTALRDWQTQAPAARQVLVKVHPRDEFDFSPFPQFQVLPRETSVIESLTGVDVAVSRCSGTLGDALLQGIPYLACRFTQFDRTSTPFYLLEELAVDVLDETALRTRLNTLPEYRAAFAARRRAYCQRQFKEFTFDWLK